MTEVTWSDMAALELLTAVEDYGSIGAAADALGLSQPNASRALSRLERHLHLSLILRHTSGSTLTGQGRIVASWARMVALAKEELEEGLATLRARDQHLHIAASQTVAEYVLPAWLSAFRTEMSGEISLEVANSRDVLARLREGSAHLGFVESVGAIAGLNTRIVGRDQLVLVVRPDHPWAGRRITAGELAVTPLLVREEGSGTREAFEMALLAEGHTPCPPAMELASNAAVRTAAASSSHPAILSEYAVREAVSTGRLSRVSAFRIPRVLRAVWPQGPLAAQAERLAQLAERIA